MYHEFTDFDVAGGRARRFVELLGQVAEVQHRAWLKKHGNKQKVRRLDVTAVMMFLQDASRNPLFKLDPDALGQRIADATEASDRPVGKSTSPATLQRYYEWWRAKVAVDVGVQLDPRRTFDEAQKAQIRARDGDKCAVCGEFVPEGQDEYDHYPVPYRDGGPTEIGNGRLVHRSCHPRGRPPTGA